MHHVVPIDSSSIGQVDDRRVFCEVSPKGGNSFLRLHKNRCIDGIGHLGRGIKVKSDFGLPVGFMPAGQVSRVFCGALYDEKGRSSRLCGSHDGSVSLIPFFLSPILTRISCVFARCADASGRVARNHVMLGRGLGLFWPADSHPARELDYGQMRNEFLTIRILNAM